MSSNRILATIKKITVLLLSKRKAGIRIDYCALALDAVEYSYLWFLVVGYAVYSSGVRWEAILEGETLSPGDRAQLDASLESAQVRLAGLMLDYWDGDSRLECKKI